MKVLAGIFRKMASPIYSMKIAIEEPTSVPIFSLHDKAKVTAPNYQILPTETDLNTPKEDCIASNSSQKYEDFAVSALVENEDQTNTDVIAHLDVLKQLLATAYSEAELSLVVQCFGGTLVLSPSGCVESPSMVDGALLNKFARLSMMESCGCRLPTPNAPTVLEPPIKPKVFRCNFEGLNLLVGHDLLLLSNANCLTSLHLWDETAVTSFTWMDAWLGNVIASVPEVAVCYHEKGVVNGYDFLKTSEIPSEKGISLFDGSVLHQGVQVLKFLHFRCKQDGGSYWLHRKSGDDQLQLFDLSKIEDDTTTSMKETLTLRKGRFYLGSGDKHLEKEDGDKAEAAYHNALAAFKQVADSNVKCNFVGRVNYGLGEVEGLRAEKLSEDNKMERNGQPSSIQAILESISYHEEANIPHSQL